MANRTIAERIAKLETQRDSLESAIATSQSAIASSTQGDQSFTLQRIDALREELTRVEKSLQRLYRGGRGMPVDLSYANGVSTVSTNS